MPCIKKYVCLIINFKSMKEKELQILSEEELSILKGGNYFATSSQVSGFEMGKDSCCNIHIKL